MIMLYNIMLLCSIKNGTRATYDCEASYEVANTVTDWTGSGDHGRWILCDQDDRTGEGPRAWPATATGEGLSATFTPADPRQKSKKIYNIIKYYYTLAAKLVLFFLPVSVHNNNNINYIILSRACVAAVQVLRDTHNRWQQYMGVCVCVCVCTARLIRSCRAICGTAAVRPVGAPWSPNA